LVWRRPSFHSENAGKLAKRDEAPLFVPCTPKGIIELLKHNGTSRNRVAWRYVLTAWDAIFHVCLLL